MTQLWQVLSPAWQPQSLTPPQKMPLPDLGDWQAPEPVHRMWQLDAPLQLSVMAFTWHELVPAQSMVHAWPAAQLTVNVSLLHP